MWRFLFGAFATEKIIDRHRNTISWPQGLSIGVLKNNSDVLMDRINLMKRHAIPGIGAVCLSLVPFPDLKLTLWAILAFPVTFVTGIVVDTAVLVGEHIFDVQGKGGNPVAAKLWGLRKVAASVTPVQWRRSWHLRR